MNHCISYDTFCKPFFTKSLHSEQPTSRSGLDGLHHIHIRGILLGWSICHFFDPQHTPLSRRARARNSWKAKFFIWLVICSMETYKLVLCWSWWILFQNINVNGRNRGFPPMLISFNIFLKLERNNIFMRWMLFCPCGYLYIIIYTKNSYRVSI